MIAQVIKKPHVVVTRHPREFNTGIGKLGQFAKKSDIATRDDILILVPIVEDVAKQEELGGIVLDAVQETANTTLPVDGIVHVFCPQVQVGYKICIAAGHNFTFLYK